MRRFAFVAAALWLAAPAFAENHLDAAVQPGGDIPAHFQPTVPPIPKGGDIPRASALRAPISNMSGAS